MDDGERVEHPYNLRSKKGETRGFVNHGEKVVALPEDEAATCTGALEDQASRGDLGVAHLISGMVKGSDAGAPEKKKYSAMMKEMHDGLCAQALFYSKMTLLSDDKKKMLFDRDPPLAEGGAWDGLSWGKKGTFDSSLSSV